MTGAAGRDTYEGVVMASRFRFRYLAAVAAALGAGIALASSHVVVGALAVFALAAVLLAWSVDDRRVRLLMNGEGVFVNGKRFAPARVLAGGFIVRRPKYPPRIRLVDRFGLPRFDAHLDNESQGRAMLRALGLDAGHKSASFAVPNALLHLAPFVGILPLAIVIGTFLGSDGLAMKAAMVLLCLAMVAAVFKAGYSRVTVGADGVLVRTLVGEHFVPYGRIVQAEAVADAIVLRLIDGSAQRIDAPRPWTKNALGRAPNPVRDTLLVRIEDALADFRRRGVPVEASAHLARGGRSVADWQAALTMRAVAVGYRAPAAPTIPEEELWRIAEDPGAEETARAGAAVALRAQDTGANDDAKARLWVVARATASPRVRVALEAVADATEDDELAHALDVFDEKRRA